MKSLEEINKIREEKRKELDLRVNLKANTKEKLGIDVGQTTEDGKFSIEATRCIGACGLAPVFTVNEEVYGKATTKTVDEVIEKYKNME